MARNNPKVAYLEEALSFIESIPKSAGDKLLEIVPKKEIAKVPTSGEIQSAASDKISHSRVC